MGRKRPSWYKRSEDGGWKAVVRAQECTAHLEKEAVVTVQEPQHALRLQYNSVWRFHANGLIIVQTIYIKEANIIALRRGGMFVCWEGGVLISPYRAPKLFAFVFEDRVALRSFFDSLSNELSCVVIPLQSILQHWRSCCQQT